MENKNQLWDFVKCRIRSETIDYSKKKAIENKQAISAGERALCQLTACFEFHSRSDRRKGHKSCALQMVFRRKVTR